MSPESWLTKQYNPNLVIMIDSLVNEFIHVAAAVIDNRLKRSAEAIWYAEVKKFLDFTSLQGWKRGR